MPGERLAGLERLLLELALRLELAALAEGEAAGDEDDGEDEGERDGVCCGRRGDVGVVEGG